MVRLALTLVTLFLTTTWVQAAKLALVIGNSAYERSNTLLNPGADAGAFASFLTMAGFDVTIVRDGTQPEMIEALEAFADRLRPDDVAVFFYAGHGVQAAGQNYLLGVDAALRRESSLEDEAVPLSSVIGALEAKAQIVMVFLDACRNNPLADALTETSPSVAPGLAPIEPQGDGTMIAFAAAPGKVAYDGAGEHSPFTAALLDHLGDPGAEVTVAVKRMMRDVREMTRERQAPQLVSSLATEFFFGDPTAPTLSEEQARVDYDRAERLASVRGWTLYIEKYPEGLLSEQARTELQELFATTWATDEGLEPDKAEIKIGFGEEARAEVQLALNELGYDLGTADGVFGRNSRREIAKFQRAVGLRETGYLSYSMLAELGIPFVDGRATPSISGRAKTYDVADLEGLETDERVLSGIRCLPGKSLTYGFFGGHMYIIVDDGGSQEEVVAAAARCGGYVATISSAGENSFLFNLTTSDPRFFKFAEDGYDGAMFGLVQPSGTEPASGWRWLNGEPVTYTNWGRGQPDDWEDQDIARFSWFGTMGSTPGTWDDGSGEFGWPYIIEIE